MFVLLSACFRKWFKTSIKTWSVNVACVLFLICYSVVGGFIFLYMEKENAEKLNHNFTSTTLKCIRNVLKERGAMISDFNPSAESILSHDIFENCVQQLLVTNDERLDWNLLNSVLYGFGIITTLGYGKLDVSTTEARCFAILYGFIGIPISVIIFSSFGRYLEELEKKVRVFFKRIFNKKQRTRTNSSSIYERASTIETESVSIDEDDEEQNDFLEPMSAISLVIIIVVYLTVGSFVCSKLSDRFDFWNGLYFSFLSLSAIEYGELIGPERIYIPITIVYICIGLAISTIALDIGSSYVRVLFYYTKKIGNVANTHIWFGSKKLQVKDLLSAIGQNIGIEPDVLLNIDIEGVINYALLVKEGKLDAVPQSYLIMEGIYPPSLIPLFLKDGYAPKFMDEDDKSLMSVSMNSNNIAEANLVFPKKSELLLLAPPIPPHNMSIKRSVSTIRSSFKNASKKESLTSLGVEGNHKRTMSVRFEDFVHIEPVQVEKKESPQYLDIEDIDE